MIEIRLHAIAAGVDLAALVAGLATHIGGDAADRQALLDGLLILDAIPRDPPFGTYLAHAGAVPVGVCAFNGMPGDGSVEIGYHTLPAARRRGVASAMVLALVDIARANGLSHVHAHTLPAENASTRVLARCGFALAGTAEDPDEGLVWRWECPVPARDPLALSGQMGL